MTRPSAGTSASHSWGAPMQRYNIHTTPLRAFSHAVLWSTTVKRIMYVTVSAFSPASSSSAPSLSDHSACLCPLLHVQNRVLQERLSLIEKQLASSQDDTDRLRAEREGLRERLTEMQTSLREREVEVKEKEKRDTG